MHHLIVYTSYACTWLPNETDRFHHLSGPNKLVASSLDPWQMSSAVPTLSHNKQLSACLLSMVPTPSSPSMKISGCNSDYDHVSDTIAMAWVSQWCQVVHPHLPWMPNSPNHQTAHPPNCSCHGWTLSQSPYWYYGYALIWRLLLHCPSLVRSDCVSGMAYAAIQEHICNCVFYFQGHPLSLGCCFWARYW